MNARIDHDLTRGYWVHDTDRGYLTTKGTWAQDCSDGWFKTWDEAFSALQDWERKYLKLDQDTGTIRKFATGATRDSAEGKYDYEGFLSPFALERFAAYMHKHRRQSDGSMRDSDNWQNGIPNDVLVKSAWRHFHSWWKIHRGGVVYDERDGHRVSDEEAICGLLFNAFAYLHDLTKPCDEDGYGYDEDDWDEDDDDLDAQAFDDKDWDED